MFKRSSAKKDAAAQTGQTASELAQQTISEQAELTEQAVAAQTETAADSAAETAGQAAAPEDVGRTEAPDETVQTDAEPAETAQTDAAQTENTQLAETEQSVQLADATAQETKPAVEIKADKNRKKREKKAKGAKKRTLGVKKGLSNAQKGIVIALSVLLVFGIAAVIMYFASGASKSVYVFPVENAMQDNMYFGGDGNYGVVSPENIQSQYVSESQKVNEIYVKTGDRVKVGDLVMSYDTTLDSLQVDKKALEVSEKELELVNLKKQLSEINSMKPSNPNAQPSEPEVPVEHPTGELVLTYKKLEGTGTESDPYIYILAGSSIPCDDAFLNVIFADGSSAWVVFENRTANMTGGRVNSAWGVHFTRNGSGDTSFDFFDASDYLYTPEPGEDYVPDMGSGYTAAEIAQMRSDTQKEITDTDLKVRMMKVELAQMRLELSGGDVYSKVDGVVTVVRSESEARENGEPVLVISGGGGYVVNGTVSELMLDSIKTGDKAVIMSFETGMNYDGEIISVLDLPVTDNNYMFYSEGVAASYYPVRIFVDESANLRENEYVSINFDISVRNAKYLESMYILSENGSSYVYVEGDNGLLEKRRITTGGTMWGYLTQVTGGLTGEEYIAFPYGNNVHDGAKVHECTMDEFYSHMYGY